jgi:hypothetical protein
MFLHTFYTWVLANLLHPIMFFLATVIMGHAAGFDKYLFESALLFLGYSFCFSFPCLLLGWLTLYLILASLYSVEAKFLLWLVTAPSLNIMEFLIILSLFDLMELEILLFLFPGVASVGASILIRYSRFKRLIHTPKIENHETNLV